MVAFQSRQQGLLNLRLLQGRNRAKGFAFHKQMWGYCHQCSGPAGVAGGKQKRYRRAVAMPKKYQGRRRFSQFRWRQAQRRQQSREHLIGLNMHKVSPPGLLRLLRLRLPIAGARIHQTAALGGSG